MLNSYSKNQIKHINQLKSKKFRKKYGEFIAEGEKIVAELLHSSFEVTQVFALSSWVSRYETQIIGQ